MTHSKSKTRSPRTRTLSKAKRLVSHAVALSALTFLLTACQSAQIAEPLTADHAGNDPDSQTEFWRILQERDLVSNDEAFHALLLFNDGADEAADYEGRVARMKQHQFLPNGFDKPAEQAVHKGDLAVTICRMLDVKGGLAMRLTGLTPRYCTRELVYLGIYPQSSPQQTLSGAQFMGLLGTIEDVQTARRLRENRSATPPPVPEFEDEGLGNEAPGIDAGDANEAAQPGADDEQPAGPNDPDGAE